MFKATDKCLNLHVQNVYVMFKATCKCLCLKLHVSVYV